MQVDLDKLETEVIDKLFLELSQVTKAKTKRELALEYKMKKLMKKLYSFSNVDYLSILLADSSLIMKGNLESIANELRITYKTLFDKSITD